MDMYSSVRNFIDKIKKEDKICIIYHKDVDGICSAVLILKLLYKNKIAASFFDFSLSDGLEILEIFKRKYNKIIFLDIPIDQAKATITHMINNTNILIIDHHPPKINLSNNEIIHFNIHFEKNVYQPTSYLIYKIFETELKEYDWIAIIGTISDYGIDDCLDLILKFFNKKPTKKEVSNSKLMKIADMLYGNSIFTSPNDVVEILFNSESLKKLESNKFLKTTYKKYKTEIERCKKEFLEKSYKEFNEKFLFWICNSKYKKIVSSICTELCAKNSQKVYVIGEKRGEKIVISARTEIPNINLGKIFSEISNQIQGAQGGGHPVAAGITIPKNKLKDFKEMLIQKIKPFLQE